MEVLEQVVEGGKHLHNTQPLVFGITFVVTILLGLEILNYIVVGLFHSFPSIPIKGKHLDKLEFSDNLFIFMNKLITGYFSAAAISTNTSTNKKW